MDKTHGESGDRWIFFIISFFVFVGVILYIIS